MVQPKDNSKKLTLLGDYASQPSRAIFIFCLLNNIPHQIKLINVIRLEQYDEEFKKINPNAKVPAIIDGDVNLFESHTILRYLHQTRNCPDHWYPACPRKRAKVDEYLDWHHNGLRLGAGGYFFRKYMSPLTGKPAPKELIQESLMILQKALTLMENYWLKDENQKFLTGNEITIADLSAACELGQTKSWKLDLKEYPKVQAWLNRVFEIPEVNEMHKKVIDKLAQFVKMSEENAKL